ncbi:MAG: cadherin-like beta sandwich domain-containing protein [Deltaproteobacteria bacterium]|nr:cadherin-like beta sandwich domain-containing protein [Deltaproteobacteria bacterium]
MDIRSVSRIFFFAVVFLIGWGIISPQAYGTQGDVNDDGNVNLTDAVLALQVISLVQPDDINTAGDADGDTRIGLQEAVYVLQRIAGLRGGGSSAMADLSALTFCCGTLSPAFDPDTALYYTMVENSISEITVTATAVDTNASMTLEGLAIVSGEVSDPVHIDMGINFIDIVVTAEDGTTTQTYTINVYRQEVSTASNAYLADLSLSTGNLNPAFHPDTIQYTAGVSSDTEQITVTATTQAGGAYVMINGAPATSGMPSNPVSLVEGENDPIVIRVISEDTSVSKTYQIVVTRGDEQELSINAFLAGLSLSTAPLNEVFFPALFSYSATVANSVTSVRVTPVAGESHASITVNGAYVASGSASAAIDLSEGANTLSIEVTAQDTSVSRTYDIIVTRESAGASNNANLSGLVLSASPLNESFVPGNLTYTANVLNYVEEITVTATAANPQAAVTVNGSPVSSGQPSGAIVLACGENVLEIAVTAEDGTTAQTYTINIYRHGATTGVAATVYVVDAPASPPFEFETLPLALKYLADHLTADQLGEVRIKTTQPMVVDELSIGGNVIITLESGASNTIVGPGTSALVVNAAGSLDIAGLNFINAAGFVINSSVGLAATGSSFNGDTAINLGGGASIQSIRSPLESSGAYGFVSKALQFNSGTISGGLTVNASGGVSGGQQDIEITNTQASSAGLFGSFSESSYLNLKANLIPELNINVDLRNESKLDVTGHMNLDNINTVLYMDGNAQANFNSNTMTKLIAEYKGLKGLVSFQNTFTADATMKVNNDDFDFVGKSATFNYFKMEASYGSASGRIGIDLEGGFVEKSFYFNGSDLPLEASLTVALRGFKSNGPTEFHASGRITYNFNDEAIFGAEAKFIYDLGAGDFNADHAKFLGKVFIQSTDQAFEFNGSIIHTTFENDVAVDIAGAFLVLRWDTVEVEEGHRISIQGEYDGVYPQEVSSRSPLEMTEGEIVFSGLNIKGSPDFPALFIGNVDVPVTIENSTIKSNVASIVLHDVNGAVTIKDNPELVGGISLNGDPDSAKVIIDKTYTITGNNISHTTPGMSCIHTHAIQNVLIADNDMTALGFATHGVHVNGGRVTIRRGSIITSGPDFCQAIGVGESAGGHNGIVYAEEVEPITGAVQTGKQGYVKLTDNTFSNAKVVDYKEGLTAYPRLLNDPVADNSGLNPDEDIIGSLIDWNEDTHHCPDYPTKCDGWDDDNQECGCGEDGVSPPGDPGV